MTGSSRRTYRHGITVIIGQEEMSEMPKASKDSVSQVKDFGVAEDRSEDLGGYTVNFVSILADHDLGPMLAGLPGGGHGQGHAADAGRLSRIRQRAGRPPALHLRIL